MSFFAKNVAPRASQLKVQKLSLPLVIVGNATPASKTVTEYDRNVLFMKVEGIDHATAAVGALDSDDTVPTFQSVADATGLISCVIRIDEELEKVVSAKIVSLTDGEIVAGKFPSAPTNGIVAGGDLDKIALDFDMAANFTTGTHNLCIEVEYIVK